MHNFLGHDGFVWWIGQVVSIDDPMVLGRCQIRIFGYHGEAKDIPDADLPWAVSIHPVNTPNLYGTPRVGDFVFGFFLDALAAQEPAMLGYFPYSSSDGKSFSTVTNKNDVVLDVDGNVTISAGDTLTIKDKNGQYTIASLTAAIAAAAASGGDGGGGTIVIETGGGTTINLSSVTQSILPSTTETYDLGSSSKKWRSLYVSGSTIYIGGNALSINDDGGLLVNGNEIETGVADGSITAAKIASSAITADKIADGTITNAKLSNDFSVSVSASEIDFGNSAITLAKGTTAQRPESPETGMIRFNTSNDGIEIYTANSGWLEIYSLAISNVTPQSYDGSSGSSFTITGSGFTDGCQVRFVTIGGTEVLAGTVAINSLTQITATTPRNFLVSEEPLGVKVTNPAGISASFNNVIDTGGVPAWANNAGSLGTVYEDEQSSVILLATDPEGQSITYSLSSGAIPQGMSVGSSNGIIHGTPNFDNYNASGVTYNFDITAQDSVGNQTARSFSILKKWYDGSSSSLAASSITALQDYGLSSGSYWIDVPTIGAREIYCDVTEGWYLLMRGYSYDSYAYGNAAWTNGDAYNASNLLTNQNGSFAKSDAFYYLTGINQIKLYAGGFSGNSADGQYRNFTFSFVGTGTPRELMFTTANQMSWDSSYSLWRSTFGHDRTSTPKFERYGSPANQTIAGTGGRYGCGQPLMFGFNASDGNNNDVNSGLGTHPSYCGGDPGGFARGSWMGNGGYVRIWARTI